MLKVYIADKIYIKMKDLPKEVRQDIVKSYMFNYKEFDAMSRGYVEKTVNLMEVITWKNDEKWISIPANLDYFLPLLKKANIKFMLSDRRVKPKVENFPLVNIELRDNQLEWLEQLDKFDYNAIMALATGQGKTLISIYIGSLKKTPTLFCASKTSYIKNFKKELQTFVSDYEDNYCEINTDWLRNGAEIKPFMSATIQALQNEDILEALKDKVGLLCADEVHLGMLSKERRKVVYGINPRYRIYLSATPDIVTDGFINAVASPNFVTSNSKIDFDIKYQPICIDIGYKSIQYYKTLEHFAHKKNFIFSNKELINSIVEFVVWQKEVKRGCLVFNTSYNFQTEVAKILNSKGIKTVCFNQNTKKEKYEEYFEMYDRGEIDVIVGGTSVVEALSLYRLSTFIDTDLSETPNQIIQKIGRLKRKDNEISDKDKVYVKLIYKDITENKFKFTTIPTLKTMKDYVKILPTKHIKGYSILDLFI